MSVAAARKLDRRLPRIAEQGRHRRAERSESRWGAMLPSLAGILAIAVLQPLRDVWSADLVLATLALTLPGVLALRALRVPTAAVIDYPVFLPAASLLVVMFGGLAGDLLGPLVGIAHPLRGPTTAISTLLTLLVLWTLGIGAHSRARFPWGGVLRRPSLFLPLALPLLAAAGALLLSNGHGPDMARGAAVVVVLALLICLVRADRWSRAQVGVVLFACALAAEWAFSIRGQEVIGFDISTEIHVAQHAQAVGFWHARHPGDAYGAMLSITLLPATLTALAGISPVIAFKLLYPLFAAVLPLTAYVIGERFMSRRFAALAAALIIAQSYFFQLMPQLARQEVGLLFFAALAASLTNERLPTGARLRLVIAMAIGLIVSHYSSAYMAIPTVGIAFVMHAVISRLRHMRLISLPLLAATSVLIGGAVLWYGSITESASNVTSFAASLENRGLDLLPNSRGNLITSFLGGNSVQGVSPRRFEQLAVKDYSSKASYIRPLAAASRSAYSLRPAQVPTAPVRLPRVATAFGTLSIVAGELMLAAAVLGALLLALRRSSSSAARATGILALGTVAVLVVIRFSGTAAAAYNQQRALLQSLILLTPAAAWLASRVTRRLGPMRVPATAALAVAVALVFAYQSGASALLTGGGTSLNLSQRGEDFERQYVTPPELAAASWVTAAAHKDLLYADRYGQLRLFHATGRVALTDVTPKTLDRRAWIYGSQTNVVLGRTRGQVGNFSAIYQWPSSFLSTYFDTVYTNGDSEVFHR